MTTSGTRRSQNGNAYPATRLTRQELSQARRLTHRLICEQGLSIRRARLVVAEKYGIRRSVGIIAKDLADYECPACAQLNS